MIWDQTKFRSFPNQPKKGKYNLIPVDLAQIRDRKRMCKKQFFIDWRKKKQFFIDCDMSKSSCSLRDQRLEN